MDGTPFGRYSLVELLGRGGMGEVWRAFDTHTERVVAVKVLPSHLVDDKLFQERFRREARAAAGLDEPHVVPIHHFGEIDGRLYVTMRLIKGSDLQALLDEGPISPARAVGIIEQIASALHAAHRIGLVHRDVKPSNILVAEEDFAYLIDFGIARAAGETGLTSTGATVGTWAYMAPERFQKGTADARSDIYSLASVLYQSLTGQVPFPGDSLEQIAVAHMFKPPPQPSMIQDGIPAAMDDVIATGMAKEPEHRYQTARELAHAARDAITVPIPLPTPSLPPTEQAPLPPTEQAPLPPTEHAVATGQPRTLKAEILASAEPSQPTTPVPARGGKNSRRTRIALIAGAVVISAAVAAVTIPIIFGHQTSRSSQTPTTQPSSVTPTPSPITASALPGLLLSPDEIGAINGATGLKVTRTWQTMPDDSADVTRANCLAFYYPGEAAVYSGSGLSDIQIEQLEERDVTGPYKYYVAQAVVLFPSASQAAAFVTTSAQQWSNCSNRQLTATLGGKQNVNEVGPLSNDDGILSTTGTQENANGWACERALTRANNVVIDIRACSYNPANSAVDIARQIAAKVPAT